VSTEDQATGQYRSVLALGAGGMLGHAFLEMFERLGVEVDATDLVPRERIEQLDVRDVHAIQARAQAKRPDVIVNLAALTDLEHCEENAEDSWLTNGLGAENAALVAARLGIPMIHISTAGIFDGSQETFTDFDEPNPMCVYAKSKYYGELAVQRIVPEHFVFRAGWMMGGGPSLDKKFINKIFRQIQDGATDLYAVSDKLGTPTYTHDFAANSWRVLHSALPGIYNQVCTGESSRYDVAVEFVRMLDRPDITVHPVDSEHFARDYYAPRPASEMLVNTKLIARDLNGMRPWQDALGEYAAVYRKAMTVRDAA
jgi:dTDP-4-dehydrorhamnose reductase